VCLIRYLPPPSRPVAVEGSDADGQERRRVVRKLGCRLQPETECSADLSSVGSHRRQRLPSQGKVHGEPRVGQRSDRRSSHDRGAPRGLA